MRAAQIGQLLNALETASSQALSSQLEAIKAVDMADVLSEKLDKLERLERQQKEIVEQLEDASKHVRPLDVENDEVGLPQW